MEGADPEQLEASGATAAENMVWGLPMAPRCSITSWGLGHCLSPSTAPFLSTHCPISCQWKTYSSCK